MTTATNYRIRMRSLKWYVITYVDGTLVNEVDSIGPFNHIDHAQDHATTLGLPDADKGHAPT